MKLVDITKDNWFQTVLLTTNANGKATVIEEFVASNALSIVQSIFEEGWITKGIEVDDKVIGFAMYGHDEETSNYWICRLMIDHTCQGKGYGKEAIGLVLEEMKKVEECDAIYLSTEPENEKAIQLYESFGFVKTGNINEGEAEMLLQL